MGQLLSEKIFPTVRVYGHQRSKGPLFNIVFINPDEGSFFQRFLGVVFFAPLFILGLIAVLGGWYVGGLVTLPEGIPEIWILGGVVAAGMIVVCVAKFMAEPPFASRVEIQIDLGNDQFNVFRKKKLKVSRPWSSLYRLTVGEHPDVPLELEKKRGKIGPKQRQHCLFGWFGPGGAEKVLLLSRWEWPPQGSLFEVQQAIEWTRDMIEKITELAAVPGGRGASLPPPLD